MNPAQFLIILALRLYRSFVSPFKSFLFGPAGQCRFSPSCSCYAMEAVHHHGASAGAWLALRRLLRCHPWGGAGHDPVPLKPQVTSGANGIGRNTPEQNLRSNRTRPLGDGSIFGPSSAARRVAQDCHEQLPLSR